VAFRLESDDLIPIEFIPAKRSITFYDLEGAINTRVDLPASETNYFFGWNKRTLEELFADSSQVPLEGGAAELVLGQN